MAILGVFFIWEMTSKMKSNINVFRSYKSTEDIKDILAYIYGIILEKIEVSLPKSEIDQYN